jgi:hypothetical protein
MPYRRRISESRVRENRMHGLMREGRGDPVLYSTPNSVFEATIRKSLMRLPNSVLRLCVSHNALHELKIQH